MDDIPTELLFRIWKFTNINDFRVYHNLCLVSKNFRDISYGVILPTLLKFMKVTKEPHPSFNKLLRNEYAETYCKNLWVMGYTRKSLGKYLPNFENLRGLVLSGPTSLRNSHLVNLTQLRSLTIWRCNEISDESIQHLTNLRYLAITSNKSISNNSVNKLTNLTGLNVINSPNIFSVRNLTNLTNLGFDKNSVIDVGECLKLKTLAIRNSAYFTEETSLKLTNIKKLILHDNEKNISIESLKNLPSLTHLVLKHQFASFQEEWLKGLTSLHTLKIHNRITSEGINYCKNLKLLYVHKLHYNKINFDEIKNKKIVIKTFSLGGCI